MKAILHKLFPYAPYLNEYIGFEDDVLPGENPLQAAERLRKFAEQSHRERYPHLYSADGTPTTIAAIPSEIQVEQRTPKEQQIANFVEAISTCTSLKSLEIFEKLVERENNPTLTEAYDNKKKEFQ